MTYFASGATMTSFFGISVMSTSVVSTRAAMDAAFSMALMVTLKRNFLVGEGEVLHFNQKAINQRRYGFTFAGSRTPVASKSS